MVKVTREKPAGYWSGRMHGGKPGDRRAGVVWHTQGSGKSFSILFYAARMVRHPAMQNPTLVVLTDRNDLDDQLFGQFQRCHDIQRAVADKATVPIYYESRIAKLGLNAAALPKIDKEFEDITEGEEQTKKEKLKSKRWKERLWSSV